LKIWDTKYLKLLKYNQNLQQLKHWTPSGNLGQNWALK
jgi:hypothetical protein